MLDLSIRIPNPHAALHPTFPVPKASAPFAGWGPRLFV